MISMKFSKHADNPDNILANIDTGGRGARGTLSKRNCSPNTINSTEEQTDLRFDVPRSKNFDEKHGN
jgi:hypothetical protein